MAQPHILDHTIDVLEKKLVDAKERNKDRPNAKHQEAVDSFTVALAVLKLERTLHDGWKELEDFPNDLLPKA